VLLTLVIVPFALWLVALVQVAQSKAAGGTIALWIVIITIFPLVGAILWFVIGRRTAQQGLPSR
jgi:Phospholipase_D-nuclease N-terminal